MSNLLISEEVADSVNPQPPITFAGGIADEIANKVSANLLNNPANPSLEPDTKKFKVITKYQYRIWIVVTTFLVATLLAEIAGIILHIFLWFR